MNMGKNKTKKPTVALKTKLKKDPGIPRLPALKDRAAAKQQLRAHKRPDEDSFMASEPSLASLAAMANTSNAEQFEADDGDPTSSASLNARTKEQIRRHYIRMLHKVIDQSDIVILVLDARDPEGCRSRLVEEEVRRRESEGKKLVFVLNKIDLIPRENAQLWLRHLRHSTPTLPFRSSTSSQRTHLTSSTAPSLLRLLKAYKPSASQSITVGVVGFPNVGKSSLINSMKRAKVCAVAAQAGHTKDLQSIQLERGIKVVDSPGVVFDEDEEDAVGGVKGSILLRNVVKVEDMPDPIAVVEEILARTQQVAIQKIYNLPEYTSTLEFLTMLALNSGRLLKGGTPDLISAARVVITDWNHQKIPYFSLPPTIHPSLVPSTITTSAGAEPITAPGAESVGQAQILSTLGKAFTLDGLFGAADAGAFGGAAAAGAAEVDELMVEDEAADGLEMMDEDINMINIKDSIPSIPRKRSRSPSVSSIAEGPPTSTADDTDSIIADATATVPSGSSLNPLSKRAQAHEDRAPRVPKRQRRNKDVPEYDAPVEEHARRRMDAGNPLSRKVLKNEAKKARRTANRAVKAQRVETGDMEVDDDAGSALAFTFMA